MMKKLRSRRGESIPEVLVSMLLVVLTFLFLTGAVVSAARVNDKLKNSYSEFHTGDDVTDRYADFKVSVNGVTVEDVRLYEGNGYYYYDKLDTGS